MSNQKNLISENKLTSVLIGDYFLLLQSLFPKSTLASINSSISRSLRFLNDSIIQPTLPLFIVSLRISSTAIHVYYISLTKSLELSRKSQRSSSLCNQKFWEKIVSTQPSTQKWLRSSSYLSLSAILGDIQQRVLSNFQRNLKMPTQVESSSLIVKFQRGLWIYLKSANGMKWFMSQLLTLTAKKMGARSPLMLCTQRDEQYTFEQISSRQLRWSKTNVFMSRLCLMLKSLKTELIWLSLSAERECGSVAEVVKWKKEQLVRVRSVSFQIVSSRLLCFQLSYSRLQIFPIRVFSYYQYQSFLWRRIADHAAGRFVRTPKQTSQHSTRSLFSSCGRPLLTSPRSSLISISMESS